MEATSDKRPITQLAAAIYAGLIAKNGSANAEELAKESLRLAQVFFQAEEDARDAAAPIKPTYNLDKVDISSWTKA